MAVRYLAVAAMTFRRLKPLQAKGSASVYGVLVAEPEALEAAITNESVDELKLAAGQAAYAVVKASDVMVAID